MCDKNFNLHNQYRLKKWLLPQTKIHRIYENNFSVSTQSIYNDNNKNQSTAFINTQTRTRITCDPFKLEKFEPPDHLHPVDRIGSSNTFIIENANSYTPPKQQITRTFEEYLQQLNEYDKIMLTNVTILDMSTLIENITKEKR